MYDSSPVIAVYTRWCISPRLCDVGRYASISFYELNTMDMRFFHKYFPPNNIADRHWYPAFRSTNQAITSNSNVFFHNHFVI